MIKKDLKQLGWSFLIVSIITNLLYSYFAKDNFSGMCGDLGGIQEACTYFQYIKEALLVITLFWFGIFLFVFLITALTRKLNQYGFYAPSYLYENKKWYFMLLYPFIRLPLGVYLFFRAIKRWIMNQPTDYPKDNI